SVIGCLNQRKPNNPVLIDGWVIGQQTAGRASAGPGWIAVVERAGNRGTERETRRIAKANSRENVSWTRGVTAQVGSADHDRQRAVGAGKAKLATANVVDRAGDVVVGREIERAGAEFCERQASTNRAGDRAAPDLGAGRHGQPAAAIEEDRLRRIVRAGDEQ